MAGNIFTTRFGDGGYLWDEGRMRPAVMMALDRQFFEPWKAGDRDAMLSTFLDERPGIDPSMVKRDATSWYNYATRMAESEGDVWIYLDGTDLHWAETIDAPFFEYPHQEPGREVDVVAIGKPVASWSNVNRAGARLSWQTIHPKARASLPLRRTVEQVQNPDMQRYIRALIDGDDLSEWHDRADWKEAQPNPVSQATYIKEAIIMMRRYMEGENLYPDGRMSVSTSKPKRLLVDAPVMDAHLEHCIESQGGMCKITGLPFHFPRQENANPDFFPSPDRIDSNGHYEPENVQVVCRFLNFWKGARDNEQFRELLKVVARSPAFRTEPEPNTD